MRRHSPPSRFVAKLMDGNQSRAWLLPKPYAAESAWADSGLQLRAPQKELRDVVLRHRRLIGRFPKPLVDYLQGIAQIGTTET